MMKQLLKNCTLILLLFNAAGAIYGGYHLMLHPNGESLGLPLTLLRYSGFDNYCIPGIILFIVNGLYGLFVVVAVFFNIKNSSFWVIIQGCMLTGWIIVQLILIQTFSPFHAILGGVGIVLILLGYIQMKNNQELYPINSVL